MITPAWAQAAPGGTPPALMQFMPLVLIFVVFYFLLIRPQQQKAKEHRTLLANLKRNDDVITSGGLYGKIMALTDKVVTLEIAPNVRVRLDRQQVASLAKAGTPEEGRENKDREKDKPK